MSVAVTGGGTGGHIYPAVAVIEALREEYGADVVYYGGLGRMEEQVAREHDIPFVGLPTRKLRKLAAPDSLLTLLTLFRGFLMARRALRQSPVTVLLGTGGYVAAAAALAAASLGIPVVLHEQNAISGRANRWLARWARRVCVTFEQSVNDFPAGRAVVTGLPLRKAVLAHLPRDLCRDKLGMPDNAFLVLVLGGSQGALAVNKLVAEAVPLLPGDVALLHQTGASKADAGEPGGAATYRQTPFLKGQDLSMAYGSADLVVSRSGASTLAEITVHGLPSVLIPYPYAYADHQTANAEQLVRQGAAILAPQAQLTPDRLANIILELKNNPDRRARMSEAAKRLARPDAARTVARIVWEAQRG